MREVLVSVIIPIFNMEDYLEDTVNSVLSSEYKNIEIILIDDGSTDNSLKIAQSLKAKYSNIELYTQANSGVVKARNSAIAKARGKYIYPLDSDDILHPAFLTSAVEVLEARPEVKVVCSEDEFIGERTGRWNLPDFSRSLLARKNMIAVSALYRKADWIEVGGYNEQITATEDWAFWISLLKDDGEVVRLPQVGIYYRIRKGSKRITDRKNKKQVIDTLNTLYPDFFERELNGPLRYSRTWSKAINTFSKVLSPKKVFVNKQYSNLCHFAKSLPEDFDKSGSIIYKGRNELREYEIDNKKYIVKSYCLPHLLNRFIYRFFRATKAERSYKYAGLLRSIGINSPMPVGYSITGSSMLLGKSYFISLKSETDYNFRSLLDDSFPGRDMILKEIAKITARMHNNNIIHKDYSPGNILFGITDTGVNIEIIDLNRMRFGHVDMKAGCVNFDRLPGTEKMFKIMAYEYASLRGFDPEQCYELIIKYNKELNETN